MPSSHAYWRFSDMPVEHPERGASVAGMHTVGTPIGTLWLAGGDDGLRHVSFRPVPGAEPRSAVAEEAAEQLRAYFAGELEHFDLPLSPQGTDFQRRVWAAVAEVRYGETASYAAIAAAIGRPTACRAVGAANGRNPLAIVVPCHRVVGSAGALTGYGGGLERKRALLDLERAGS
jgi:methylated-DNA-[protein]-cysteine S-methyltransferase